MRLGDIPCEVTCKRQHGAMLSFLNLKRGRSSTPPTGRAKCHADKRLPPAGAWFRSNSSIPSIVFRPLPSQAIASCCPHAMEIAAFLEQPVRMNPRKSTFDSLVMPTRETTSSQALSQAPSPQSVPDLSFSLPFNTHQPTSPRRASTSSSASFVPRKRQIKRSLSSSAEQQQQEAASSASYQSKHQRPKERGKITKSACQGCRKRKAKVRLYRTPDMAILLY